MTTPRDFGPMANEIREGLDSYSREELADLLTHILRVFVIEGGSPQQEAAPRGSMGDLSSLSFSQLVLHLQMNLPHPELQQLRVSGSRVWVEGARGDVDLTETEEIEQPPDEIIERSPAPVRDDPFSVNDPPFDEPRRAPAATGPVAPLEGEPQGPRPGAFRPRGQRAPASPGSVAEDAGRVQRPSVGLRDQEPPAPRQPPPAQQRPAQQRPAPRSQGAWLAEEVAPNGNGAPEDKVDDLSDRFSMLELD